ncbi:Dolichyl-phosphate-mannose-protein mannosyltransferase-domain-containing protein [Cladochytrium replicatum]|nr:Dolichyl-phosphate-mannose-protein mannosyltransferase-domain-containing protein [Cladochytrium replicatum]
MADEKLRKRKSEKALEKIDQSSDKLEKSDKSEKPKPKYGDQVKRPRNATETMWGISFFVVCVLSFATRFWRISEPSKVVFDEVHFGKFASYYLRGTYFFDVHPPLGKLMIAGAGYLVGYDGHFLFENINDDYIENKVPYISLRMLPASCGALTIVFAFLTLKEVGLSIPGALFGAALLIFDNALVTQSRLILLDSMLMLFALMSTFSYVKFYKLRHREFTPLWWTWLSATGVCLALTLGVKMVGLFIISAVGVATLVDLWRLLDIQRGLTIRQFTRHFAARALCLIFLPLGIYLSFFYVHFAILTKSGPGDAFMSPAFQAELIGSDLRSRSSAIPYSANITLKHRDLSAFLHSHADRYPRAYDDGRISSEGQQVTGYPHRDLNNHWEIIPVDLEFNPSFPTYELSEEEKERNVRYLRNGDHVRLRHIRTNTFLVTHDVASSLMSTHMEMTTLPQVSADSRYNETLWKIEVIDGEKEAKVLSRRHHLRVVNYQHRVAIHCHKGILPDWGFGQHEVNGNKNQHESYNTWFFDEIMHDRIVNGTEIGEEPEKRDDKKLSFVQKFLELQGLMISHNAGLTKPHPYSSTPITWPFVLRGISFWETKEGLKQIYLLGNPLTWWTSIIGTMMYVAMWILDRILLRRGLDDFGFAVRRWWDRSIGFLFITWALHWLPHFLMGRMLFLHHYLLAYIFSAMTAAAVLEFIGRIVGEDTAHLGPSTPASKWLTSRGHGGPFYWLFLSVLSAASIWGFWWFSPLSYGSGFATQTDLKARKWLTSWDLQHA